MMKHNFKKGDRVIYDGCNCIITSIDDFWAGVWDGYNTNYAKIEHLKPYKTKHSIQENANREQAAICFLEKYYKWLRGYKSVDLPSSSEIKWAMGYLIRVLKHRIKTK